MALRTAHLIGCLLLAVLVQATHIVGGDIYYDHLGGNQYRITMTLYRDCGPDNNNGTGFDNTVQIGMFNSAGGLVNSVSIPYTGETQVPVILNNPCLQAPPQVCVRYAVFETVVNLPPIAGGYTLAYHRCCRTPAIQNLQNASSQGLTCTTHIPGPPHAANSSPRFLNYPSVALCVGEDMVFDHSAVDPDGDELVYSLCAPFQGGDQFQPMPAPQPPPYNEVVWGGGYSTAMQVDGTPPLTIDPNTGQITVHPTMQAVYAVGIMVKEYRNGVQIGETRRDFMLRTVICDANITAVVADQTAEAMCDLTQSFTNNSVNGEFWHWDFGDPAVTNDTSSLASPTWTYSAPGSYQVTLVANPGWPCADTAVATYHVNDPITVSFMPPTPLCGAQQVDLEATGNFSASATVDWSLGPATPSTAQGTAVSAVFPTNGMMPVTVTATDNGCSGSFTENVQVYPQPVPAIAPQDVFCGTLTMDFGNLSTDATSYAWDFGDPATAADVSNQFAPSWTYAEPGTYTVTLTCDPGGVCEASTTAVFNVYISLDPWFARPAIVCPGEPATMTVTGSLFSSGADVQWDFGAIGSPTSTTGFTVGTSYDLPGTHPVTVTVTENGCTGTYTDSVVVHPYPIPALLSETEVCAGNPIQFTNLSEALTPMTYFWTFGDGGNSTDEHPLHIYEQSGQFTVTLTVSTDSGCVAQRTLSVPGQVTIFPNPVAAFTALPITMSILDPWVTVEDYASGAVQWSYTVEDAIYTDPSFKHEFWDGGRFRIVQTVTSEHGCTDTTSRVVYVADHLFFAPNAFTPNGDGKNDTFAPLVRGARTYELVIYDRWGVERFRTTDPRGEWSGDGLPQGVFTYVARIGEHGPIDKIYTGHVSLLR